MTIQSAEAAAHGMHRSFNGYKWAGDKREAFSQLGDMFRFSLPLVPVETGRTSFPARAY
jgi:hypothetical protein